MVEEEGNNKAAAASSAAASSLAYYEPWRAEHIPAFPTTTTTTASSSSGQLMKYVPVNPIQTMSLTWAIPLEVG